MKHDKKRQKHGSKKPHRKFEHNRPQKNRGGASHNGGENKLQRPSLFGFHAVSEAFLNEDRSVEALYITDQAGAGFEDILIEAKSRGLNRPSPKTIDKNALDKLCPAGAVHQGVGLVCSGLPEYSVQDLIIRSSQQERSCILMLDQVTDPHNVGAILRSACAFGASGAIMQSRHAPMLDGILAKTACGAIEHVPVAYETNLSRAIEELQKNGFFAIGLDERGEVELPDFTPPEKTVLVLGAEGPGLRRLIKENCDQLLRLPMAGTMPSINVSNAAAVALYGITNNGS